MLKTSVNVMGSSKNCPSRNPSTFDHQKGVLRSARCDLTTLDRGIDSGMQEVGPCPLIREGKDGVCFGKGMMWFR